MSSFSIRSHCMEKRLWLVENKPGSCVAAGELVDEFEQTKRSVAEGRLTSKYSTSVKKTVQRAYCDKSGHVEEDCIEETEIISLNERRIMWVADRQDRHAQVLSVSADWTSIKELSARKGSNV